MEKNEELLVDDRNDLDEFMKKYTPEQIHEMYEYYAKKYNLKEIKPKSEEEK